MSETYPMGPPVHYCPECDLYPCACWDFEYDSLRFEDMYPDLGEEYENG